MQPMIANFALASFMVGLTVCIHFSGLLALTWLMRRRGHHLRPHEGASRVAVLIVLVVLGLVAILTVEIWLYAAAYRVVGAFADFEEALYFSTTSFTTIGYGDVVLDRRWRLLGAIEGANGLLLFGWSTAFMLSIIQRLRMLEHDWLERP